MPKNKKILGTVFREKSPTNYRSDSIGPGDMVAGPKSKNIGKLCSDLLNAI